MSHHRWDTTGESDQGPQEAQGRGETPRTIPANNSSTGQTAELSLDSTSSFQTRGHAGRPALCCSTSIQLSAPQVSELTSYFTGRIQHLSPSLYFHFVL